MHLKSPVTYYSGSVVSFTPQPLRTPEQENKRFNTSYSDYVGAKPIKAKYLSKRH